MERSDYKIYIIGAGISGLIAAKVLENSGYSPVVLEATNSLGGRVKTDIVDGHQLDHGFQVLLDEYPKVKEHLDLEQLDLQKFIPGSVIFLNGKKQTIGDPLRDISLLFPTLFATVGSLKDKLNILKLNMELKSKPLEDIFSSKTETTLNYLKSKGFSDKIIEEFFRPFFSGIFLEPDLKTSSRMFQFVYKMFGQGSATLPKKGIGEIPRQLKEQLKKTTFKFSTQVVSVIDSSISLENGDVLTSDFTIIATTPNAILPNYDGNNILWKSCYNLYFEVEKRNIKKPIIGLVADKAALINNIFYCNSVNPYTRSSNELLSVTVVKSHELNEDELIARVKADLKTYCNILMHRFVKCYHIKQALPDIKDVRNFISPTETQLTSTIFLAGDHLLNGSLNAAITSGESAANGVINILEERLVL